MKRLALMVAILMVMAMEGYAQEDRWMQDATFKRLNAYLQLYPGQVEQVYEIYCFFVVQLQPSKSADAQFENEQSEDVQHALIGHLRRMYHALSGEQYRKYVELLDVSRSHIQDDRLNPELKRYLALR